MPCNLPNRQSHSAAPSQDAARRARVAATVIARFAKHLALLATALIIGGAAGKSKAHGIAVLLVVILAALLHSLARALQRRAAPLFRPPFRVGS